MKIFKHFHSRIGHTDFGGSLVQILVNPRSLLRREDTNCCKQVAALKLQIIRPQTKSRSLKLPCPICTRQGFAAKSFTTLCMKWPVVKNGTIQYSQIIYNTKSYKINPRIIQQLLIKVMRL